MKDENKNLITKELFDEWASLFTRAGKLGEKIEERITYVLQTYFKIFGNKLDNWYFCGAEEGQVGDLNRHVWGDEIHGFEVESSGKDWEMAFIDKDGNEACWSNCIPIRWLFEDFEQEIIDGKKLFEEKEAAKKAKRKAAAEKKKLENQTLAASAKAKLSKEELAALRKSL